LKCQVVHLKKLHVEGLNRIIGEDGPFPYRSYIVDLVYTYKVAGKQYTGNRFFFGSDVTMKSDVEIVSSLFKTSDDVTVYYNQQDPVEAVLLTEKPGGKKYADLSMALIVFIVGIALVLINKNVI